MNETLTFPVSRPKIHRLPQLPPEEVSYPRLSLPKLMIGNTVKATALGLAIAFLCGAAAMQLHEHVQTTPAETLLAMATPAQNPASSRTIFIQGDSGEIVGQLAKIPSENEQITEIKPISDIDKTAGRELLTIVSKY